MNEARASALVVSAALAAYVAQLIFIQLFVRLEPTMFGMPSYLQQVTAATARYLPSLVFVTAVLLVFLSIYRSSAAIRAISVAFLGISVVNEALPAYTPGWVYASSYWLLLTVCALLMPGALLSVAALERRSVPVASLALSSFLAASFYVWSFLSRVTFTVPPIWLIPASVYAFVASFALLNAMLLRRSAELYVSAALSLVLTGAAVYFTNANVLAQKIVNMVLQTSLGAPTPLPWFAPLFFMMFLLDIYALLSSIRRRSLVPISIAAGATMVFTSVYLPYNFMYVIIAFSGATMVHLGARLLSDKPKGLP